MNYIKGVTFGAFAPAGTFDKKHAYESLDKLTERTGADFITLVPNGLQDTPQSQTIDYTSPATLTDEELIRMIEYIKQKGLRVALKPTVNCKNGTWRAHICFFDKDVICEPKWSVWFDAYRDFQLHFASIAERTGCDMFIAGCEMVQSEHREEEWRGVIGAVRREYHGPVSYNTDKYQEENVVWWDCVDVISSSGYYPTDNWDVELDRIEKTVRKFNKPFFFAEAGCKSVKGAGNVPNDWSLQGAICEDEQALWYETMFEKCASRDFVKGFSIWDWSAKLYPVKSASKDSGYAVYGKKAETVIRKFYNSIG